MADTGNPLGALERRAARKEPKVPAVKRGTRVRRSVSLPPEVDAQLQDVLEAIHERLNPSFTYHAMMVALLDQGSQAVLDGTLQLGIIRTEAHTETLDLD